MIPSSGLYWFVVGLLAGVCLAAAALMLRRCLQARVRWIEISRLDRRLFVYHGRPDPQIRERIADAWTN